MKVFIILLLAAMSLPAYGVEYNCLIVKDKSGTTTVLKSDGLKFNITDDGHLTAVSHEGENVFDVDNLISMEFATDPSSVNAVMDTSEAVEVFTVAGVTVGTYVNMDEALTIISTPGVYVVKSKNKTAKILIP